MASGVLFGITFGLTFDQMVIQAVTYYISDHLNTIQLLVDDQGTTVWQGEFKLFGGVNIAERVNTMSFPM